MKLKLKYKSNYQTYLIGFLCIVIAYLLGREQSVFLGQNKTLQAPYLTPIPTSSIPSLDSKDQSLKVVEPTKTNYVPQQSIPTYIPTPTQKPARIPMILNARPWSPITVYCDSDKKELVNSAIDAHNNLADQLRDCLKDSTNLNDASNYCYEWYPVGYKDHMYATVLLDALTKYCNN